MQQFAVLQEIVQEKVLGKLYEEDTVLKYIQIS